MLLPNKRIELNAWQWHTCAMTQPDLNKLDAEQLRALVTQLMGNAAEQQVEVQALQQRTERIEQRNQHLEAVNAKLSHELLLLRRLKFGKQSEKLDSLQRSLLEDIIDADTSAIEQQWADLVKDEPINNKPKTQPKRVALPAELPRTPIRHEPQNTQCQCGCQLKRIGEDISEKLDYTPGVFSVEQHIRGKWICTDCETLTQAPVPAHVIDKGLPTTGLLAHVLVASRQKVPDGTATAKAIDYSLKRWGALIRYLDDGGVPIDNNQVENQMRPWALGRKNWLFAGSLRSGRRAAAVMSLIQSARLNGHDPYEYLKDVLARLPTQKASAINELLPHSWSPEKAVNV